MLSHGLAAVHHAHLAVRHPDVDGLPREAERHGMVHAVSPDVAVGRDLGAPPFAQPVALGRQLQEMGELLLETLVARLAMVRHLPRVQPCDPAIQVLVELVEVPGGGLVRGSDSPLLHDAGRAFCQALVLRLPDAGRQDAASIALREPPACIIELGHARTPKRRRRAAVRDEHVRHAAKRFECPHVPVQPAPHRAVGAAPRPDPSWPRQADDGHERLRAHARDPVGDAGGVARPVDEGLLPGLMDEMHRRARPLRLPREDFAELGIRVRKLPGGSRRLAVLGPHELQRQPRVPRLACDDAPCIDLEMALVGLPGLPDERLGYLGLTHGLYLRFRQPGLPEMPGASARIALAAARCRRYLILAMPASGKHQQDPPVLGHEMPLSVWEPPWLPQEKALTVPSRPDRRYHPYRINGTSRRYCSFCDHPRHLFSYFHNVRWSEHFQKPYGALHRASHARSELCRLEIVCTDRHSSTQPACSRLPAATIDPAPQLRLLHSNSGFLEEP